MPVAMKKPNTKDHATPAKQDDFKWDMHACDCEFFFRVLGAKVNIASSLGCDTSRW